MWRAMRFPWGYPVRRFRISISRAGDRPTAAGEFRRWFAPSRPARLSGPYFVHAARLAAAFLASRADRSAPHPEHTHSINSRVVARRLSRSLRLMDDDRSEPAVASRPECERCVCVSSTCQRSAWPSSVSSRRRAPAGLIRPRCAARALDAAPAYPVIVSEPTLSGLAGRSYPVSYPAATGPARPVAIAPPALAAA